MGRKKDDTVWPVQRTEAEWREQLSDEQFHVTRKAGTERAFSGPYWDSKSSGTTIVCAATRRFSKAAQNMIAARAGPAFGSRSLKARWQTAPTTPYL